MKPRRVIVYMVVFALLGLSYYFLDVRPSERESRAEADRNRIFDLNARSVTGFVLVVDGVEYRVGRADAESWRLLSPMETPADRDAVDEVIRSALDAKKQRSIKDPGPPAEYRLDPAPIGLTMLSGAGTAGPPLFLGDPTPAGDAVYGRSGDSKDVFTVPPGLRLVLNRTLFDLRDKSVVPAAVETIDRLVIHGSEIVELRKKGVRNWEILRPEPGPADEAAVERILYAGLKSKAIRFVQPDRARPTGLDDPAPRVEVFAGGRLEAEIAVGGAVEAPEDGAGAGRSTPGFWVKSSGRPELLIVEPKAVSALRVGWFDVMERHVLNLDFRNLSAVNLDRGQTRLRAEKIRNIWDVSEPSSAVDGDRRITRLIAALADLRHVRQLDDRPETLRRCGLDRPDLSIALKGPEEEATLEVGLSLVEEKLLPVRVGRGPVVLIKPDDLLPALPGEIGPVKIQIEPADGSGAAEK